MIDVSNPVPAHRWSDSGQTLITATRNVVGACAAHDIQRLVVLTIAGIQDPTFDGFPYYEAKRVAKEMVLESPVRATIVKSTQWYEFATNLAVTCNDGEVIVEDWLIQPIAADSVADVLVEAALGQTHVPRTITGPAAVRLPDLTSKLLARRGDGRRVRAVQPRLPGLAAGALLARRRRVIGPDIDTWLHSLAPTCPDGRLAADEGKQPAGDG